VEACYAVASSEAFYGPEECGALVLGQQGCLVGVKKGMKRDPVGPALGAFCSKDDLRYSVESGCGGSEYCAYNEGQE
jgi:hypothetical protein